MITPEQKDAVLIKMTEDADREWLDIDPEYAGMSETAVNVLVRQLERRGFVRVHTRPSYGDPSFTVTVELDADDFIRLGGFQFEEDAYRNNFIKLELELQKLEGEIPQERWNKIMTLVNTTSAAVSAYNSFS